MLCFLKYMNKGVDVGGFYLVLQRSQVSLCHLKENPRDRQGGRSVLGNSGPSPGAIRKYGSGNRQAVRDEEKLGGGRG